MMSPDGKAIQMIDTIVMNCKTNNFGEISQNCCALTKHLFADQSLLFTEIIKYFESSEVSLLLINSINHCNEHGKRDVLRLVGVIFQTNKSIRDKARQTEGLQSFLRKSLESPECWTSLTLYKHHINIASQLLTDKDATKFSFNTDLVRKLSLSAIETIMKRKQEEIPPCMVFYACAMFSGTFEEIQTNNRDEPASENILTKEITGKCLDILREYVLDFKSFYTPENGDRNHYIVYKAHAVFSFPQICTTVTYYAVQSKKLRDNLLQAGLYEIINNLLSIINIPEVILQCGIDVIKIPLIDVTECLKIELFKSINSKLTNQLRREGLSEKVKKSITILLKSYDSGPSQSFGLMPDGQTDPAPTFNGRSLIHFHEDQTKCDSPITSLSFEKWGTLDVQQWLVENNLESLKSILPNLTGAGLAQLKYLAKDQSPMKVIDYLMDKMKISFDVTIELIGALDKL